MFDFDIYDDLHALYEKACEIAKTNARIPEHTEVFPQWYEDHSIQDPDEAWEVFQGLEQWGADGLGDAAQLIAEDEDLDFGDMAFFVDWDAVWEHLYEDDWDVYKLDDGVYVVKAPLNNKEDEDE